MRAKNTAKRFFLEMDIHERRIFLNSLNATKTDLQRQGKATDAVDDLIVKVGYAPVKRFKVVQMNETGGNRDEAR